MKNTYKILLITAMAVFVFGLGSTALAQDTTVADTTDQVSATELGTHDPTLLPNSPFYFLKEWSRGIQSFFAFGDLKKAELQQQFANERLLELQKMVEEGTVGQDILDRATEKYNRTMDKIKELTDKISDTSETSEDISSFLDKFTNQQMLQERILLRLQQQVPEEAMQKLEQAREQHMERFGEIMRKLEANKEMLTERVQNALQNMGENSQMREQIQEHMPDDIKGKLDRMTACTMEAKQCPDGSYVGRTGPNCEFTECPESDSEDEGEIEDDGNGANKNGSGGSGNGNGPGQN